MSAEGSWSTGPDDDADFRAGSAPGQMDVDVRRPVRRPGGHLTEYAGIVFGPFEILRDDFRYPVDYGTSRRGRRLGKGDDRMDGFFVARPVQAASSSGCAARAA